MLGLVISKINSRIISDLPKVLWSPSGFIRIYNGHHCFLLLFHKQRDQSRAMVLCPLYKLLALFRILRNEFCRAYYYSIEIFLSHATGHPYMWRTLNVTTIANSQGVVHLNRVCSYESLKSLQKNWSSQKSIIYSSIHVAGFSPEQSKPEGPVAIFVQSSYPIWSINLCISKLNKG